MKIISIAKEYTNTPGARYRKDGKFSGEEFREKFLEPEFLSGSNTKMLVDLDGTEGYATSFLEEAFGGLARKVGKAIVKERISFKSDEDPSLIDEAIQYIDDVEAK